MSAQQLAEGRQPEYALLDFAGGICDDTRPEKTQKNDRQTALPGEADSVTETQAGESMTHEMPGRLREEQNHEVCPRVTQTISDVKTAPHLGTGWVFES